MDQQGPPQTQLSWLPVSRGLGDTHSPSVEVPGNNYHPLLCVSHPILLFLFLSLPYLSPFSLSEPNPPEAVSIADRTNTSLSLTWNTPLLMSGVTPLSYNASYSSSSSQVVQVTEAGTSVTLSSLSSGTEYSINVSTIGALGLRSSIVSLTEYTCTFHIIFSCFHEIEPYKLLDLALLKLGC